MKSVIEILFARRPIFKYQAPAICEVNFSTSTFPVIILNPIEPLASPTGLELGGGGTSRFHLSWNRYPGALCYNVYKAVDELDPFGAYTLIAECITDNFIDLDPFGPGCYRITSVTPEGESPFSDPDCISPEPAPPDVMTEPASSITDSAAQLNGLVDPRGSDANVRFEWGLTTAYGNLTPVVDVGLAPSAFSALINGLTPATTYHFRALAAGPGGAATGNDMQFTTANTVPSEASIEAFALDEVHDLSENGAVSGRASDEAAFWTKLDGVTFVGNFGETGGIAYGINDNLDVFGFEGATNPPNPAQTTAFYFNGGLVDIGDGTNPAVANSPNSAGLSPVKQGNPGGTIGRLYDPNTATFIDMGFFPGPGTPQTIIGSGSPNQASNSNRKIINELSQVACSSLNNGPGGKYSATRWELGVFTDFSPYPAFDPSGRDAFGISVDQAGNFLLLTQNPTFFWRGYINATDLGGDPTWNIFPQALSRTNQIVCGYQTQGGSTLPFRWNVLDGYTLIDLAPLGSAGAFPEDCNSHGDIVGQDFNGVGFLVRNGITYKLITIVQALFPADGWDSIDDASLINDNRQIAGLGVKNGVTTAYLLTLPAGSETP